MAIRSCRLLMSVGLVLSLVRIASAAPKADVVVVAELVRENVSGHCGVFAFVGEAEYRVLKVVKGELKAKRILVEALCPEIAARHVSELHLSSKKWFHHKPTGVLSNPPQKRLQLVMQVQSKVDYVGLLLQPAAVLDKRFTRTETKDGWRHYGPAMQAKVEGDKVSVIRLRCPSGFPRDFPWAGLQTLTWSTYKRRGGHSVGAFTAPGGIAGKARGGRLEISKRPG